MIARLEEGRVEMWWAKSASVTMGVRVQGWEEAMAGWCLSRFSDVGVRRELKVGWDRSV